MGKKQVDFKLFFAVLILIICGMVMISSVSVFSSFQYTGGQSNSYYLTRNIIHIIASMILLVFFVKIPYTFYKKYAWWFLGLGIFLLVVVLLFGQKFYGSKGWLKIPYIPFTLQPTEFMKLAMIGFLSYAFYQYKGRIKDFKKGFLPFIGLLCLVIGLIALQPDYGSVLVILPIATILFFVAGGNVKHLVLMATLGFLLLIGVYFAGKYDPATLGPGESRPTLGYIYDRINSFLGKELDAEKSGVVLYQQDQSVIAIGSGGLTGVGFGASVQKYGYIPQVEGDFIYSVIVEELGFLGALGLIGLYLFIAYRCYIIFVCSKDDFVKYFAIGMGTRILTQAFVNIGVNLKILPNTGITLPFVSFGGSSLMSLCIGIAIVLAMSRDIDEENFKKKRGKAGFENTKINMLPLD